ncbi:MAG: Hpt domain-containing protein, partial [Deltaproteobacteria bacterium]|nr:Hpt domain-containing protein [Deltaproteobacteria bacterium]
MTDDMNFDVKELYGEFIEESLELTENVSKDLVSLEKAPNDEELISRIFRSMHTLKGNSGFIGLTDLSTLAHRMESILGKLRDKDFPYFPLINDVLFKGLDIVRGVLGDFADDKDTEREYSAIYTELESLMSGPSSADLGSSGSDDSGSGEELKENDKQQAISQREASYMRVSTQRLDKLVNLVGELAAGRSRMLQLSQELKDKAFEDVASFIASISTQIQSEVL